MTFERALARGEKDSYPPRERLFLCPSFLPFLSSTPFSVVHTPS